jgi:hypothetical protein
MSLPEGSFYPNRPVPEKRRYRIVAFHGTCSFSHHTVRPPLLGDDCPSAARERRPIELTYREGHFSVIRSQ